MSKIKEKLDDFLINGGLRLGYNTDSMPSLEHLDIVLDYGVWVWEYNGMTEQEYFEGWLNNAN